MKCNIANLLPGTSNDYATEVIHHKLDIYQIDHFSKDITCCYHGGSCFGKTEPSNLHPMTCNLRQNLEGSHPVTTGLSGALWVQTQTERLGHTVVGMETL